MYLLHQDDLNEFVTIVPNCVVHGCCIDVMPHFKANSVDMVLVDLPYGVTQIAWDKVPPLESIWREIKRFLKPNGVVCMTATQPFASDLICSNRDWFRYDLIWNKNKVTGHLNAKKMPLRSHESILVFYNELPAYNPQMTNGHDPLHYAVNRGKTELYGEFDSVESRTGATDRYPRSVLDFDVVNNSERMHPTQKPVELFSYLIKTFTNEGDLVVDIAAGSMTTGVAAQLTNRKFICIEKEEMYVEAGAHRLRQSGNIFAE